MKTYKSYVTYSLNQLCVIFQAALQTIMWYVQPQIGTAVTKIKDCALYKITLTVNWSTHCIKGGVFPRSTHCIKGGAFSQYTHCIKGGVFPQFTHCIKGEFSHNPHTA